MLAKILTRLYHACWYVFATLVLTAAVCVTLIRLTLPHIDNYREEIQDLVSNYVGYSIIVDKIEAEWHGWNPYLRLQEINVLDQAGENTLTRLQSATVSLNPATMLIRQKLSPLNITITGPELVIVRGLDGAINIAKVESTDVSEYLDDKHSVFAEWLLAQHSVSIQGAKIHYLDEGHADRSVLLTDATLLFKRYWKHIQIDVSAKLPEIYGESFNLSLDAFGDITTPQWSGQIYFNGKQLYPGTLFAMLHDGSTQIKLNSAPADIHLWSSWNNGKLNNLDGRVDVTDIQLEYEKLIYDIQHLDTLFSIRRDKDRGFKLRLNIEELVTTNGLWPRTSIEIHKERSHDGADNFRYVAKSDYLKIEDLFPLLQVIKTGDEDNAYSLSGTLINSLLVYDESLPEPFYIDSDLEKLAIKINRNNSLINNISGHIESGFDKGLISLDSSNVELVLPEMHMQPLVIFELAGDVIWKNENDVMIFESSLLESHTAHFNASLHGKLSFDPENDVTHTNLQFRATDLELENLVHYVPSNTPEGLQTWIKDALLSGHVSSLDIILRGNINEFPFNNMEGQFKTVANIRNASLDYHPDWTPVDKLDAELVLDNDRLIINAQNGYIYNAEITNVTAVIDILEADDAVIDIKGNVKGHTQDAIFIVQNSPLSESSLLGELKNLELDGPIALNLDLNIPLDHKPMSFNGNLIFENTLLKLPFLGIELNEISGHVLFTQDAISTKSLKGKYFNQEVSLDLRPDDKDKLIFSLAGSSNNDFIAEQLVYFFPAMQSVSGKLNELLDGSCRWNATLSPDPSASDNSDNPSRLLTISSDLAGIKINLPAPLGKDLDSMPLEVSTVISEAPEQEINISLGDLVSVRINLGKSAETTTITRTEIALGNNTQFFDEGRGIFIHGSTDYLSLSDWQTLIDTLDMKIASDPDDFIQADLFVTTLAYHNQHFTDTNFTLNNTWSHWQAVFNGTDIEGDLMIARNNPQEKVKGSFRKLYLQGDDNDEEHEFNLDPRLQPPVELTVDDFNYGEIKLGQLDLITTHQDDGLSIDSINFTKPGLTINGQGKWQIINDLEFSTFDFLLNAEQLKHMLKTFDYSIAPVKDGTTRLELNATWNGSPMDFSLAKINGSLDMSIEKGQFLNIDSTAGRLFGLLSIQTLPRRLSLDFSDLFGKGFAFDRIEGSFTIESGDAYTNNLTMVGPSADIGITGRTGLIEKDYDQIVTVTPQISDSLPLASALFGPIGAGVGAVLFLAGELFQTIPKQIDKLLRYQYTISGSWDDPVVEKYTGEGSG